MANGFNATRLTATVGGNEIIMECGKLANQADGAVWIQSGETVVMVTVVTQPMERQISFFPLVVDYSEKMYAAGRIPGSFFRREMGRPNERETLCSRLIDRPVRPLFPKGFKDEVQILASVLSSDQENDPDVLALTGASAALHNSRIPFMGPIAGGRIGYIDGNFVLNPTTEMLQNSSMNLVLAASRLGVVMVEGLTQFLPEELVADALVWGREALTPLLDMQDELREKVGKPKIEVVAPVQNEELRKVVIELAQEELDKALCVPEKMERKDAKKAVKEKLLAAVAEDERFAEDPNAAKEAAEILGDLGKEIVRRRIAEKGVRIDGRDLTTVRDISIETGLLPRAHGSALFARGETKALTVATLGSGSDAQKMETLMGTDAKRFLFHYNFPPYSVGEVKMIRVSRREVGHGMLAERALTPVLPSEEEFPFTLRIVSETLESNGSSSMAAVCGASLAFMDAGVPIKAAVAGTAMGLIKQGEDYFILTDILGDEDALGDMDFKIAGTAEGVTAVQMDIKVSGIPPEVMRQALAQARQARLTILEEMNSVLDKPRPELSKYAPKLEIVQVSPDILRVIIGPGGKNIKAITAATGASVDIEDSGKVSIFAPNSEALELAKAMVLHYDQKAELGKDYVGKVKKLLEIGALVEILPGVEALVHISQLDIGRVEKVTDIAKLGEEMKIKVIEINDGRVRGSRAVVLQEERGEKWDPAKTARPPRRDGPRDRDRGRSGGGGDRGRGGDRNR
jgi:polyribonucleotide nucleotidyltransferase